MKIEIKLFNDRARFTPSITFMRLKKRTGAAKPVHYFVGHDACRKILTRAGLY